MKSAALSLLLCTACVLAPLASARDNIEVTPFGPILVDLLKAFHAKGVPCEGVATQSAEVCFESQAVGASYLAERLQELIASYEAIGLSNGDWRSANGVWTVSLKLPNSSYGQLEVYLAEAPGNLVKGVVRLVEPY